MTPPPPLPQPLAAQPPADRAPVAGGRRSPIERVRDYLDRHFDQPVTLETLARIANMSPHHLQRTFKAQVGVSPREYQRARRLGQLKARLRSGETVSRATFDAGFGSSSRVYERAQEELGMTPAAYRAGGRGITIRFTVVDTRLGRLLLAATERGVCSVALGEDEEALEAALRREFPRATIGRADDALAAWAANVAAHVSGAALEPIPLDVPGTDFQWEVWRALQEIPPGSTRSYRDIAIAIGRPAAARAVARACASNRVALLIPCHRVVRGEGTLGGYRWGVDRKRALLRGEGAGIAR